MTEWPGGFALRTLDSVDSTNSEAERLKDELTRPTWIFARMQTAGRGRRNRSWRSLHGNLFATLAMKVGDSPGQIALRSFVSALALRDASVALSGGLGSFSIKWPNDLLAGTRKYAGILLECDSCGDGQFQARIGFGVNVAVAPGDIAAPGGSGGATSFLEATGVRVRPEAFLQELASAYAGRELQFREAGFESIRLDWLSHAAKLGETVGVTLPSESFRGIFRSIDRAGRAIVDAAHGRRLVAAADMYF